MHTTGPSPAERDSGFTLVELLIVIVILGVLSTVTVFAVSGITSRGDDSAEAADEQVVARAQEAYMAQNGVYGTEADLVSAGLLREASTLHDIELGTGNTTYTIVAEGAGATTTTTLPPNTAQSTTFAGFDALSYGSGSKTLVFLSSGNPEQMSDFDDWVAANPPIADTELIIIDDPTFTSVAEVETAIAQGATAWIAAYDYTYKWTATPSIGTPIWYVMGGGVGAFGNVRSPGLSNVIQWTPGDDLSAQVTAFPASY